MVILTRSGFVKRLSLKAFKKGMETGGVDENHAPLSVLPIRTNQMVRVMTDGGNMYSIMAEDIPESRLGGPEGPRLGWTSWLKTGRPGVEYGHVRLFPRLSSPDQWEQ